MSTLRIRPDNGTIRELKIPKEILQVLQICDIHHYYSSPSSAYLLQPFLSLLRKIKQKTYFFDMNTL